MTAPVGGPTTRSATRRRPVSITIGMVALGMIGLGVMLLGGIALLLLAGGARTRGVPPALMVPACVVLATMCVTAIVRLRAGARSGWVLGVVFLLVTAVALTWDATVSGDAADLVSLLWPMVGLIALFMPASRAYVGVGRPPA